MSETNKKEVDLNKNDEISIRELLLASIEWLSYLKSKWLIIVLFGILGAGAGIYYAYSKKTVYVSALSFALEEEKGGGSALAGAMGLASSLGLDMGSGGGIFNEANLMELMKSRSLVEKALLNPITVNGKTYSLAGYYININGLHEKWQEKNIALKDIEFKPSTDRSSYTIQQDSILETIYSDIVDKSKLLSVAQKNKKSSLITIEVKSQNELFAKVFAETLAKEVSDFYIETRSKKARNNVNILQKQTDSVRNQLNNAISGVASLADNTFNLNSAFNVKRVPSSQRQIDVQANTAILTQLVANLEMAKVTLLKETPLIQVIDKPILPLPKIQTSKIISMLSGGIAGVLIIISILIVRRLLSRLLNNKQ